MFGQPQACPVMLLEWDLFVQDSVNSDRFTVPREPLCPGLPYGDMDMQHSCNHGYIFEKGFFPIFYSHTVGHYLNFT